MTVSNKAEKLGVEGERKGTGGEEPKPPTVVSRVLTLRADRHHRAVLRRARQPETRYSAVPLIGSYLSGSGSQNEPAYLFAALSASFPSIGHAAHQNLGRTLRQNDPDRGNPDKPVARRLFMIQRQPLHVADTTFRSLLSITEPASLNWIDVYWLYSFWDHKDRTKRITRRQQLLEQYYRPLPNATKTDEPTEKNK